MFTKSLATVAINLRPRRGSWGGANQWTSQLTKFLRFSGYSVRHALHPDVACIVMTHSGLSAGTSFGAKEVATLKNAHPHIRCIHRINDNDVRKGTDRMDAVLAETNRLADHTVFVSEWLRDYHASKWFDLQRPHSVIAPGADPAVFHPIGNCIPGPGERWRVVTHHWSNHWSKGFDVYAEIDQAIADGRLDGFELWVIGRWPADLQWKTARTFPPASGRSLADRLRQCHIYVSASRAEPGAMHPVEGIQCGLPIVFHAESGGTATGCCGLGLEISGSVVEALKEMGERYLEFRHAVLTSPPSGDLMCLTYRRLIQRLITEREGASA